MIFSTCFSLARTGYFCSPSLNYSLHRKHTANNCYVNVLALNIFGGDFIKMLKFRIVETQYIFSMTMLQTQIFEN